MVDVGPPVDADRLTDRCCRRQVDPVPVRLLEQLRLLVLGGGVQPEAVRLQLEVPAVFVQAPLAHVDDLLTLEERVDDGRPFLARRSHPSTIGGSWTTRS